ncbi:MCE family protein [Nocardioides marmorisolisilvae]|uniref:MCE family protein n=1 Tax=Nocardioides marmorisolisilvae TaxID=1542737 RepID=A0A3N0DX24_9ACTN|nr:MCE family protein [Nocardioides marmorisolisilvae]RNL80172.1 MCE family protein [Nocardioides marmorisolisilvae]
MSEHLDKYDGPDLRAKLRWLPPLLKLTVYTSVIASLTVLLALIIVNARSGPATGYKALFTDASGVSANDNVKIAGVVVGRVNSVKIVNHGTAQVSFSVDSDVAVPADVHATVRYENLVGDRFIELQRAADDVGRLRSGATIPLTRTAPAVSLTVLFGGFQPLFQALEPAQVNQLADEILRTLQGESGTVSDLLEHTASLTSTLADRDQVIGSMITNLNSVLGVVSSRDTQLSTLVVQLQKFVTGLSDNRHAVGSAISSLSDLTNSVGDLLVDARPPLKSDVASLGKLATALNLGSDTIDEQLKALPDYLNSVDRTASYGSWFQFFLCDLGGSFSVPAKRDPIAISPYHSTAGRCD